MMSEELVSNLLERFPSIKREEIPEGEDYVRDEVPVLIVPAAELVQVAEFLRDTETCKFDFLKNLTAVDYEEKLVVVYHLYSLPHRHKVTLKVELDREAPSLDSVVRVWKAADWQEREVFDLFGVTFNNHPDLRRILLPEDWEGYPLRKDYVHEPDQYD